jgi:AraC-like DNA-binding protein
VSRGRSELARLREPTCHVYQQLVGTYHYQARGQEHVLRPGDLMVTAPDVTFEGRPEGDSSFRSWALPPGRLLPRLPGAAVPLLHVPRRPGVGELVASAADVLAEQADHLGPDSADAALNNLCVLIGIAGGVLPGALEGGREAVRAARLARAKQHIDRHLHDPDLDAAGVARAAGVSERQLQLLFERDGKTFTAYLTRRRLEEVRAALARPGVRSVTELAIICGFGSVPTFYRAFRRAYGAPPGDLRVAGV